MPSGKKIFALLLLLALPAVSAETIFWVRGNDETVSAAGSVFYALYELPPDEFSTTTTILKTASAGTGNWTAFYHNGIDADVALSGNVYVWLSYVSSNNADAKMKFALYDFNPSTGQSAQIAASALKSIPSGGIYQDSAPIAQPYTLSAGHKLKLEILYDAPAGASLAMRLDEGESDTALSWNAPNGSTYNAEGVKNSGALLVNASGLPQIACADSSQCGDGDPSTVDICYYAGTYGAFCSSEVPGCSIACGSDSECTVESGGKCSNKGSCSSACSYPEQQSLQESQGAENFEIDSSEVICGSNNDCDDGIPTTTDSCSNAGTAQSFCLNTQCGIACTSSSSCDDGNPVTNDLCLNAGACSAACNNVSCNPLCSSDSDCDDSNPATLDVCAGAGRCTATCENLTSCGNNICEASETECSCAQDCGTCGGSISDIYENACIGNSCRQTIKLGVCGNGRCELGENFFSCAQDCKPQNIGIEFSFPDGHYVRGEAVQVKASVLVDGEKVSGAKVRAKGFFGDVPLLNDGRHDDGTGNDNVYANTFTVPIETQKMLYPVTVYAEIGGVVQQKVGFANVVPKISVSLDFDKKAYILGDDLKVEGKIGVKGKPSELPIDLNFSLNGIVLSEKDINSGSGFFTANYRTTLIDEDGNYSVSVYAIDANGNIASLEKGVRVLKPEATNFLVVELKEGLPESVRKGENIRIEAMVYDVQGNGIEGADVEGAVGGGKSFTMQDSNGGVYGYTLNIPSDVNAGIFTVKIRAVKQSKEGAAEARLNVLPLSIEVEILKPQENKTFLAGEEMLLEVRATLENGSPLITEKAFAEVNGEKIRLKGVEKGLYSGSYLVRPEDEGKLSVRFSLDSGYGEAAEKGLDAEVSGVSYLYYARKYTLQIILGIIALALLLMGGAQLLKKRASIGSLKKRERQIIEKIKAVQTEYFVGGTLDKKNYDKYMEKYESELQDIRESINAFSMKAKKK